MGLYLVAAQAVVNAAEVARLSINPAEADGGFAGYPAEHRGVTEFEYEVDKLYPESAAGIPSGGMRVAT